MWRVDLEMTAIVSVGDNHAGQVVTVVVQLQTTGGDTDQSLGANPGRHLYVGVVAVEIRKRVANVAVKLKTKNDIM